MSERDKKLALLALAAAKAAKDRPAQKGEVGERGEVGPQGEKGVGVRWIGEREGKIAAQLDDGQFFEIVGLSELKGERGESGRDGQSIVGPAGKAGKDGKDGRGIENVAQPSDNEFILRLTDGKEYRLTLPRGAKGDRGERGQDGIGIQGPKGDKGEKGDKPAHEWEGTKLRFERPDGTWGEWVDLKGKDGRDGRKGFVVNGSITGSGTGGEGILSIVAGSGISIDNSDPKNPVISATGGGTGNKEVFINEQPAINYPAISYSLIPGTNLYRQSINVVV